MNIETIVFKKGLPISLMNKLTKIAEQYYDNKGGKVINTSKSKGTLVFVGHNENERNAILYGSLFLYDNKYFVDNVDKWTYEDTNCPEDNCNVMDEYMEADRVCQRNR